MPPNSGLECGAYVTFFHNLCDLNSIVDMKVNCSEASGLCCPSGQYLEDDVCINAAFDLTIDGEKYYYSNVTKGNWANPSEPFMYRNDDGWEWQSLDYSVGAKNSCSAKGLTLTDTETLKKLYEAGLIDDGVYFTQDAYEGESVNKANYVKFDSSSGTYGDTLELDKNNYADFICVGK